MHDQRYYEALGFRCGLEIHQRLATKEKLFCRCRAAIAEYEKIRSIERRQRAVAGELGTIDAATQFESGKERRFTYGLFRESTCLVDIDEEPPHPMNAEALDIAMIIAVSLNAKIPDELEPMRKGVVDGSDPSAFQRSMLCAYNGSILVNGRGIPIPAVFLEEESSGIVSSSNDSVVYRVDRLGIPLIEIDTGPVIATPQEAKDAASAIGLMLRLTGRVQRGIGSIRQDVNISVKEGARVEVKGFQELDIMDVVIENEVERQVGLNEIKEVLKERNAGADSPIDVTDVFSETTAGIIRDQIRNGGVVLGVRLAGYGGMLGREINTNMRLGSEISDRAKMAGVKGIMHSDEDLSAYGITDREKARLKDTLGAGAHDAFVLIAEKAATCTRAMHLAIERAVAAISGVPSETRVVDARTCTTRFLRPIPGGSRMYPETDAFPINPGESYERARAERIDIGAIRERLFAQIPNRQLAEQMLWSRDLQLYKGITETVEVEPALVASILLEKLKELSRKGIAVEKISSDALIYTFKRYHNKDITKAGIGEILAYVPKSENDVEEIMRKNALNRITGTDLERIVNELKAKRKEKGEMLREIMSRYRLNVDGDELTKMLGL